MSELLTNCFLLTTEAGCVMIHMPYSAAISVASCCALVANSKDAPALKALTVNPPSPKCQDEEDDYSNGKAKF